MGGLKKENSIHRWERWWAMSGQWWCCRGHYKEDSSDLETLSRGSYSTHPGCSVWCGKENPAKDNFFIISSNQFEFSGPRASFVRWTCQPRCYIDNLHDEFVRWDSSSEIVKCHCHLPAAKCQQQVRSLEVTPCSQRVHYSPSSFIHLYSYTIKTCERQWVCVKEKEVCGRKCESECMYMYIICICVSISRAVNVIF